MLEEQGDWTQKVQALLARARPTDSALADAAEARAQSAYRLYDFNMGLPVIEQTPRARAGREINRIALTYGWQSVIARVLDAHDAVCLEALDDDTLDQLLERMRRLVDSGMTACDSEEDLPAR